MATKVLSETVMGLTGVVIEVEADISTTSLPSFVIVGLPDAAVQESRERIRSAIKNSSYKFPAARIAVNLAPADIKKQGPSFDLPIALALLIESKQCTAQRSLSEFVLFGELSLDGSVRGVNGVLPMVIAAKEQGVKKIVVPQENVDEARVIDGLEIYGVACLSDLAEFMSGEKEIEPAEYFSGQFANDSGAVDFSEIKGQEAVKRALEIAAAGGHNILPLWTMSH